MRTLIAAVLIVGCGNAAEPAPLPVPPTVVTPTPPTPPTPPTSVVTPETVAPPPTAVAPTSAVASGFVVAPFPLVLRDLDQATLGRDSADPQAVVVHAGCDVRVAEPTTQMGGARTREMLASIGATFTTDEVADDRWALAYQLGSGTRSIQHGLVADGHTYVCRGDFATAEAQTCGAALCARLASTGGSAGAITHEGAFVVSCAVGDLCLEAHEDARAAHRQHCAIAAATPVEGACRTERPTLGRCVMPDGMQWVYYGGGQIGRNFARTRCELDHGTFTEG